MRSATIITFLGFIAYAHAKEVLVVNNAEGKELLYRLPISLGSRLLERACEVRPIRHASFNDMMLGKNGATSNLYPFTAKDFFTLAGVEELAWTGGLAQKVLALVTSLVTPLLQRVAAALGRFGLVNRPGLVESGELEGPLYSCSYTVGNVSITGLETLGDVRALPDDRDHINLTSSLGSLTASVTITTNLRMGLGGLKGPAVRAQLFVVARLRNVSLTTRWCLKLRASQLLQVALSPQGASSVASLLSLSNTTAWVQDVVLELSTEPTDRDHHLAPAPLVWRMLSAAFEPLLILTFQEQIAAAVRAKLLTLGIV